LHTPLAKEQAEGQIFTVKELKRQELAVLYSEKITESRGHAVGDNLFSQVQEYFSTEEIVELTMLVGYMNMLNLFNNTLHLELHD